jgi:hypothetical protein
MAIFLNRRRFAIGAVAAATAAVVHPAEAIADSAVLSQVEGPKPAPPADDSLRKAMAKLAPRAQAEVEMKYAEVLRKYGSRLNEEQKADVHRILAETQEGLEKMRAFALENGDQPATVFQIDAAPVRPAQGSK